MKVLLFWYLQSQAFYKSLHQHAVTLADIDKGDNRLTWADVGCGVGLMSRIADVKGYKVDSYDLDSGMIRGAKFLNRKRPHLTYTVQDVMTLVKIYDVVSATSLLSVVPDKKATLSKLQSLLHDGKSTLILIEPTEKMSLKNAWKMVTSVNTFFQYKMLLVWANARQGQALDKTIFDDITNISHYDVLNDMVRITVIKQKKEEKL